MPRSPIAALIQLALGSLLGAAGTVMLVWAVMTYLNVERGFDAAMWAAEHSPIPLAIAPVQLANGAIQDGSLVAIGVAGFFLCLIGSGLLSAARANLLPLPPRVPDAHPAAASRGAAAASPGSTIFAHSMLSDTPSPSPPRRVPSVGVALDEGSGPTVSSRTKLDADLEGLAQLFGQDGKFTAQQRAALARLTPEQQAGLAKLSKWAPSRKNALIALIALFFAFQLIPSIFSLLLNR